MHYTTESASLPNNLNKFEKKGLSIFISKREGTDEGSHVLPLYLCALKFSKEIYASIYEWTVIIWDGLLTSG